MAIRASAGGQAYPDTQVCLVTAALSVFPATVVLAASPEPVGSLVTAVRVEPRGTVGFPVGQVYLDSAAIVELLVNPDIAALSVRQVSAGSRATQAFQGSLELQVIREFPVGQEPVVTLEQ